jgi:hypothetical protein
MVESRLPMFCSSCGAQVSSNGQFCSTCGRPLDLNTAATLDSDELGAEQETISPAAHTPAASHKTSSASIPSRLPRSPSGGTAKLSSSDPLGGARFTPGQMIAGRYRVVSLAGRGGMGEVYRAEDLTLGQLVAIKFLPEALSQDVAALARFHSEVRIARQVSHPNVCRVFDIGDSDGTPFLSMEYVDGEDLASVVRRIGRLSPDKATEIARQICAGLAAAHERGVVHRDLKPANVMLDGAGKIRITDFGLAGIAASIQGADVRAGTPAYMAPEQLSGKEVSSRSDIYSLGLILYEILTGKRAFEASTLPELIKLREQGTVTNPSSLVRDLDPLIERVILRCLENEPAKRPGSALQVAAALPGGDPLAAALAAGETPSPEMVAAAGATEGVRPRLAIALLAVIVFGLVASIFIAEGTQVVNRLSLEYPPDALAARARELIAQLGLSGNASDSAYGFDLNSSYLKYIQDHDKSPSRWNAIAADRPPAMTFWYRQSPRALFPGEFFGFTPGGGQVTRSDPPMLTTGMVLAILDMKGRLLHLEAVPAEKESPGKSPPNSNWPALFLASGMDPSNFKSVAPEWAPLAPTDSREAWTGVLPGSANLPIRIEAAAYHGKPVYFRVLYPWSSPSRDASDNFTRAQNATAIVLISLFLLIFGGGILVARWNIKSNRADLNGAARLGAFVFLAFVVAWALRSHHIADFNEVLMFLMSVSSALLQAFFVVILYVALEPFVRRREPQILISWSRLLAGQLRDPLVGRDLLIGAAYGVILLFIEASDNVVLPLFGKLPPMPGNVSTGSLLGVRHALALVMLFVLIQLLYSLCVFFVLFVLQRFLRKTWLAVLVVVTIGTFLSFGNTGENPVFGGVALVILYVSFLLVLKKYGLLPLIVGLAMQNVLISFPATVHLSRWYAAPALAGLSVIFLLTVYAFRAALAGQSLFSVDSLDR